MADEIRMVSHLKNSDTDHEIKIKMGNKVYHYVNISPPEEADRLDHRLKKGHGWKAWHDFKKHATFDDAEDLKPTDSDWKYGLDMLDKLKKELADKDKKKR